MSLRVTGVMDFVHHPEFYILENLTFQKLDLFPSSDDRREGDTCSVGSLRKSSPQSLQFEISVSFSPAYYLQTPPYTARASI
jgi:hypothetical protein